MGENQKRKIRWQYVARIGFVLALVYALLVIPEGNPSQAVGAGKKPFAWSQAQVWAALEHEFVQARDGDKTVVSNRVARLLEKSRRLLSSIASEPAVNALDPRWSEL